MIDVFRIANLFVEKIQKDFPNDVALVVYYGSYATGSATATSDLDFYYIPESAQADQLYRSFVFEGRPFEFWGVSWGFAQKIAAGKHHWSVAPSIIANAKVLYTRTEQDLLRFQELQKQIASLKNPQNKPLAMQQAVEEFRTIQSKFGQVTINYQTGYLPGTRWAACQLINSVLDCLALINQVYFVKDWASEPEQIHQLNQRPEGLLDLIQTITTTGDVERLLQAAQQLMEGTRKILVANIPVSPNQQSAAEILSGYYAAIKEYTNKIISACEKGNWIKAGVITAQIQTEWTLTLALLEDKLHHYEQEPYRSYQDAYKRLQFPDLAAQITSKNLPQIAEQAKTFDQMARKYILDRGAQLNEPETFDELALWIDSGKFA